MIRLVRYLLLIINLAPNARSNKLIKFRRLSVCEFDFVCSSAAHEEKPKNSNPRRAESVVAGPFLFLRNTRAREDKCTFSDLWGKVWFNELSLLRAPRPRARCTEKTKKRDRLQFWPPLVSFRPHELTNALSLSTNLCSAQTGTTILNQFVAIFPAVEINAKSSKQIFL